MSRSVAYWRTDYQCPEPFEPIGVQGQTYGISSWVPLSGACVRSADTYRFRSAYSPGIVTDFAQTPDYADSFDDVKARELMYEYIAVRDCFYGDYYPLIPYDIEKTSWMAWQFDRPDLGKGFMQAFRRQDCRIESMKLYARGLDPDALYEVKNADVEGSSKMTGQDLMLKGITVTTSTKPAAVLVTYKKVR